MADEFDVDLNDMKEYLDEPDFDEVEAPAAPSRCASGELPFDGGEGAFRDAADAAAFAARRPSDILKARLDASGFGVENVAAAERRLTLEQQRATDSEPDIFSDGGELAAPPAPATPPRPPTPPPPAVRGLDDDAGLGVSAFVKKDAPKPSQPSTSAAVFGLYDRSPEADAPTARREAARAKAAADREERRQAEDAAEGSQLSYKEFLTRLMQPSSAELVGHVRTFVLQILGKFEGLEGDARTEALAELPATCAQFFAAAEAHLEKRPEWSALGARGLSSARSALEKYVMSKVGGLAFEAVRDDGRDAELRRRCRALSRFVTPGHLDVKAHLCNEVVLNIARDELRRMDHSRAPADKVDCVVRCASMIFSVLNLARAENSSRKGTSESRAGADDFLPIFIYVVLHADVPRLHSNCDYVEAFHNPTALMSKAGYWFVNLRSAIEFLLTVEASQINMDEDAFAAALAAGEAAVDKGEAAGPRP
ncbi:hypothetical protein JL720_388 [Aureococcus anophagefferens]|nr:hypothetical protein JL720_388 [Aureococcus anophagefferens]